MLLVFVVGRVLLYGVRVNLGVVLGIDLRGIGTFGTNQRGVVCLCLILSLVGLFVGFIAVVWYMLTQLMPFVFEDSGQC